MPIRMWDGAPYSTRRETMKSKVKSPFMMAGRQYKVGDTVDVNETKTKDLTHLGLVSTGKEKEVEEPPKDKMAGKNKTKGKK